MAGQSGFFDLLDRYKALSAAGDPLERLSGVVDFEVFRCPLVAVLQVFDFLSDGSHRIPDQRLEGVTIVDPLGRPRCSS